MTHKKQVASLENKKIAQYAAKSFGGMPHVNAYHHDSLDLTIDILWCQDRPEKGVTSYSTIGLSDYPMMHGENEFDTRLEIAGACTTTYKFFPNILATISFIVMRTKRLIFPGLAIPDAVKEYDPSTKLPHLYFTSPFLWEDDLKMLRFPNKNVSWLLAMPISQAEFEYLDAYGGDLFESVLEDLGVDIFDPLRSSVL